MIGKHKNNQYCYDRLILENSIKISKKKKLDEKQIKGGYMNDPKITKTIEYQTAIEEKAGIIEIKTKIL